MMYFVIREEMHIWESSVEYLSVAREESRDKLIERFRLVMGISNGSELKYQIGEIEVCVVEIKQITEDEYDCLGRFIQEF